MPERKEPLATTEEHKKYVTRWKNEPFVYLGPGLKFHVVTAEQRLNEASESAVISDQETKKQGKAFSKSPSRAISLASYVHKSCNLLSFIG
jgi:hypothetical protein